MTNTKKIVHSAGNVIETLSNVAKIPDAKDVADSFSPVVSELKMTTTQFIGELFGVKSTGVEIYPGQSVEMGKASKQENKSGPINQEFLLFREIEKADNEKLSQLRYELSIILQEVKTVTKRIDEVKESLEIAVLQAESSQDISEYQTGILTKLLDSLVSFRKKIEKAKVWLQSVNSRGAKKGWVANYKKHGAKYLLSGEHYMSRSAG